MRWWVMSELFSQRQGLEPPRTVAQIGSMDEPLLNGIWNCLVLHGLGRLSEDDRGKPYRNDNSAFLINLYHEHFKWRVDEIPDFHPMAFAIIRERFLKFKWNEVYDFVEFAIANYPKGAMASSIECLDRTLIKENAGYRMLNGKVVPLTSSEEIEEVKKAIRSRVGPVRQQLDTALALLSDRKSPDPADSIKNSISAVESLCKTIAADGSKTLPASLPGVETRIGLHKALGMSLNNLYGYGNVKSGVRHGGTQHVIEKMAEARFFIVICSAWVNYMTAKAAEAGVTLGNL
jgi:hypothetical protein